MEPTDVWASPPSGPSPHSPGPRGVAVLSSDGSGSSERKLHRRETAAISVGVSSTGTSGTAPTPAIPRAGNRPARVSRHPIPSVTQHHCSPSLRVVSCSPLRRRSEPNPVIGSCPRGLQIDDSTITSPINLPRNAEAAEWPGFAVVAISSCSTTHGLRPLHRRMAAWILDLRIRREVCIFHFSRQFNSDVAVPVAATMASCDDGTPRRRPSRSPTCSVLLLSSSSPLCLPRGKHTAHDDAPVDDTTTRLPRHTPYNAHPDIIHSGFG